jgi:hypothetical protein
MILGFTEFRTNKKMKIWLFYNENFTRADVKARLYLIDFTAPWLQWHSAYIDKSSVRFC